MVFVDVGKDNRKLFVKLMMELVEYKWGTSSLTCEERVRNIIKIFEKERILWVDILKFEEYKEKGQ